MQLRDLTPADLPALRKAFLRAEPTVLRARFGGAAPKFDTLARRVRALDGHASHAVAAFSPDGEIVGVAEYELSGSATSAEVAVVVATAWQHEGLELVRDIPLSHSISYDHGTGELHVDLTGAAYVLAGSGAEEV